MTIRDRVVKLLQDRGPLEDSQIATELGILHQQANQRCRQLVTLGLATRITGPQGRIVTRLLDSDGPAGAALPLGTPSASPSLGGYSDEWYWEGNVQRALARALLNEGWTLLSEADTASKAHGVDLLLEDQGRRLAIEVKGFPSKRYADPKRAHEKKRTTPTAQAEKWYSHATLKALRMLSQLPNTEVAMGFPDFPRYRALIAETEASLRKLGVGIYLVNESGVVELLIPHRRTAQPTQELLPFDGYEGGGRQLLGIPREGGGSSRRDYGVPVFEQCGWACVYCGVDLGDAYETWLGLSVEHVLPQSLIRTGWPREWIEDLSNKVTSCRHCNEFLNQFRVSQPTPQTLEEFFELRDTVFRDKRGWVRERHAREREWFESRGTHRAGR